MCIRDRCGSLVPLADMNESRSRHALAYVESNRSIYALGGENSNGLLNHCEYYDIEKNTWTEIESLNEKRCNLSICSVDAVLYAIGGWNQDYLNIIERLNVSRKGKWEVVNVGKKEMKPGQLIGAIGIKSEEILIFGGYQVEEMLTKDCYVLNLRQSVLSKKESLREADAFIASEVKKIGDVIYAFGYAKGGIHSYDIRKDEWTWIPQGDLVFRE
eukprot:TRINITY_DN14214_c0_g1_i4.p1 TRINITY_DN14214_c0_g1~~TRINITY_DN14214_c0_g1_i4.p1  ORF type:complete len:215 (+),score=35.61 TRINITY_DN14214_c0_g1_i4:76-720(+)